MKTFDKIYRLIDNDDGNPVVPPLEEQTGETSFSEEFYPLNFETDIMSEMEEKILQLGGCGMNYYIFNTKEAADSAITIISSNMNYTNSITSRYADAKQLEDGRWVIPVSGKGLDYPYEIISI